MSRSSLSRAVFVLAALSGLTACQPSAPPNSGTKPQVTIAAAANLTDVFHTIGSRFETSARIHPVFSFASTAQLTQQIENSAPFDVFAAADATHVAELDRKGLLLAGSRTIYARGVLALWIPPGGTTGITRVEDLVKPQVRFIAIAKPELAPYGQASVETLQHLNLWERVQPKVVYAENINMAKQYGLTHNSDAVFTAYSLVLHESGNVIPVDESLHQPINQELAILAHAKNADAARRFVDFLLHGAGREMLRNSGYQTPAAP